jgi:hypothetical protein
VRASCPLCGSLEQVKLLSYGPESAPDEVVDCPRHGVISITARHDEQADAGWFDDLEDPIPLVLRGLAETMTAAARMMAVYDWSDDTVPESIVAAILTVKQIRQELDEVERRFMIALDDRADRGTVFHVRGKNWVHGANPTTRYDVRAVCSALAARVADEVVDRETGEIPPIGVIAEKVAFEVAQATGGLAPSATWQKEALARHGLERDRYVTERSWGKLSVKEDRR